MRALGIGMLLCAMASSFAIGCSDSDDDSDSDSDNDGETTGGEVLACGPVTADPGPSATDARRPELGDNACVINTAKIDMASALAAAEAAIGPTIESKYEINDDGDLALSVYPIGAGLEVDAEHQIFQEVAGDPTASTWAPAEPEVFEDAEHLKRSARDLTLVQLSEKSLLDVVTASAESGFVFWAIPTIQGGRAGYGVYTLEGEATKYAFVDGGGSSESAVEDLGHEAGEGATDPREPELPDLTVLADAQISMADGIAAAESEYGEIIEAKFELDGEGKLSLSLYPVEDITLDAQRQTFQELAGDATEASWAPSLSVFEDTDHEHLTRSARDLTLVQTSSMSLADAVAAAEDAVPGGFVYWAIPTRRGTRSGYGIYVYDASGDDVHYLFVH